MKLGCTFTLWTNRSFEICGHDAPFLLNGSSFCKTHILHAVQGITWYETQPGARDDYLTHIIVKAGELHHEH